MPWKMQKEKRPKNEPKNSFVAKIRQIFNNQVVAALRLTDAFVSIGMNDDSGTSVTDGRTAPTSLLDVQIKLTTGLNRTSK